MPIRFIVIAVFGMAVMMILPSPATEGQQRLKVGVVLPLSGASAAASKEAHEGILAVLKTEPRIEVVTADDQLKPDVAAREAVRLVEREKVSVIIGGMYTHLAIQTAAKTGELKVPLIALAAPSPTQQGDLTKANPMTITFSPVTDAYIDTLRARLAGGAAKTVIPVAGLGFGPMQTVVNDRLARQVQLTQTRELTPDFDVAKLPQEVKSRDSFVVGVMTAPAAQQLVAQFRKEGILTPTVVFSPQQFAAKGDLAARLVRNAVRKGAATPNRLFDEMKQDPAVNRERQEIRLEWSVATYGTSPEVMRSFKATSSETITCTCNSKDGKVCHQVTCSKDQGCKREEKEDTCEVTCK